MENTMDKFTRDTEISINAWNLEDLHLNQLHQIERLEHVIAVAMLASDSNSVSQLKGAISVMTDSLSSTVATIKNDHESMSHLINDSITVFSD